jgi:hypothetical protein
MFCCFVREIFLRELAQEPVVLGDRLEETRIGSVGRRLLMDEVAAAPGDEGDSHGCCCRCCSTACVGFGRSVVLGAFVGRRCSTCLR